MHELSLAMSVARIVGDELARRGDVRLRSVSVEVGALAGVELDTFRSALDAVFADAYPAGGVAVDIVSIDAVAECLDCGARFAASERFPACPQCGSAACMVTGGRELRVASVTVDRPSPSSGVESCPS